MTNKQSVVRDRAIVAQEIQCLTLVLISQSPVGAEYYGERISVRPEVYVRSSPSSLLLAVAAARSSVLWIGCVII